jgi:hypothetical protein
VRRWRFDLVPVGEAMAVSSRSRIRTDGVKATRVWWEGERWAVAAFVYLVLLSTIIAFFYEDIIIFWCW